MTIYLVMEFYCFEENWQTENNKERQFFRGICSIRIIRDKYL